MNHPLPAASGDEAYLTAFKACVDVALSHRPRALVISLGFDALESDPAQGLHLSVKAFRDIGELLSDIGLPFLLVQEGGYDLTKLEEVALAFSSGFSP